MYQQASQSEQQAGAGAETGGQSAGGGAGAADEDVVDADFEEVKDEDKK
jgi:molecular chaperone DnaK